MFLALAQYIMRGRLQAALVAFAGCFLHIFGVVAVGLLTLRQGSRDGSFMILAAIVPALLIAVLMPDSLPWTYIYFVGLVGTYIGALVLRSSQSWALASVVLVPVSAVGGLGSGLALESYIKQYIVFLMQRQEDVSARLQQNGAGPIELFPVTPQLIYGFAAFSIWVFMSMPGLVLSRWMQGLLYNPGGFGKEFRQMDLGPILPLVLFGIAAIAYGQGQPSSVGWVVLLVTPLLMQAFAVIHSVIHQRKLVNGYLLLTFFYFSLFFEGGIIILVIIGLTDHWINYRRRFAPAQ